MRNGALSVLRARQLIIQQCHVSNELFDVATHMLGLPAGETQTSEYKRSRILGTGPLSILIVCVAARVPRPASAIRVLIRRIQLGSSYSTS